MVLSTVIARSTFTGIAKIPQAIVIPLRARTTSPLPSFISKSNKTCFHMYKTTELQPTSTIAKKMELPASPKLWHNWESYQLFSSNRLHWIYSMFLRFFKTKAQIPVVKKNMAHHIPAPNWIGIIVPKIRVILCLLNQL